MGTMWSGSMEWTDLNFEPPFVRERRAITLNCSCGGWPRRSWRRRKRGTVCGSLVKGTTTSREKSLRCIFFSVTASVSWNRMARPGCCIRGSVFHSRSSGLRNSGGAGSPFFRGAAIRELRRESRTASAAPDRIRHKEDLRLLQEIFRRSVELIPPEPA